VANQHSNTISGFHITADGALDPVLGSPFPASSPVFVSRAGRFVLAADCLANVRVYTIDPSTGTLTPTARSR
jgi:6-phosphogluconolactonase (cycloisomerase 2 family)